MCEKGYNWSNFSRMNQLTTVQSQLRLIVAVTYICDAIINQNESEVGQIQFSFFWLIIYIICKATFFNRPHWNWSTGSEKISSRRVQKRCYLLFCLYLKVSICGFCEFRLILLDHITCVKSGQFTSTVAQILSISICKLNYEKVV